MATWYDLATPAICLVDSAGRFHILGTRPSDPYTPNVGWKRISLDGLTQDLTTPSIYLSASATGHIFGQFGANWQINTGEGDVAEFGEAPGQ